MFIAFLASLRGVEPPLTCLRRASLYPLSYRDTLYIITVIFNHYNPCIYSVFQILRCANILELNP